MTLMDRLTRLAELWSEATGRSQSRLATIVVNDGKLFQRVAAGTTITVSTFERFLRFFRDAANWPDGAIPPSAADFLDEMEAIATAPIETAGKSDNLTAPETSGAGVPQGDPEVSRLPFSSTSSTTTVPSPPSNATSANQACSAGPSSTDSEAEAA